MVLYPYLAYLSSVKSAVAFPWVTRNDYRLAQLANKSDLGEADRRFSPYATCNSAARIIPKHVSCGGASAQGRNTIWFVTVTHPAIRSVMLCYASHLSARKQSEAKAHTHPKHNRPYAA
ncbi:hypothetical protein F4806DRAFT_265728 [Annulohypoxylon nitens]|nr:hypothetical protein F4806DRAFT_265728 [Annulohypoxylon nitens]